MPESVWTVKYAASTVLDGELSFGAHNIMDLKGAITSAQGSVPAHVHIVGQGRAGTSTAALFYDCYGSLAEHWPNGVSQVPAITGSVIRVKPHDGQAAGLVASFTAVKAH